MGCYLYFVCAVGMYSCHRSYGTLIFHACARRLHVVSATAVNRNIRPGNKVRIQIEKPAACSLQVWVLHTLCNRRRRAVQPTPTGCATDADGRWCMSAAHAITPSIRGSGWLSRMDEDGRRPLLHVDHVALYLCLASHRLPLGRAVFHSRNPSINVIR